MSDHLGVIGGRSKATYLRISKHWLPNSIAPSFPYALRARVPRDNASSYLPLCRHAHVERRSADHPDSSGSSPINDSVRGRMSVRDPYVRSVHNKPITGGGHEQDSGVWKGEADVAHVAGVSRAGCC